MDENIIEQVEGSSVSSALVDELREFVVAGRPWPRSVEDRFAQMRPAKLAEIIRKLNLRMKLYNPASRFGAKVPDFGEVLRLAQSRKYALPFRPVDILLELRRQYQHLIGCWSENSRRRMWHIYNIHLVPASIRVRAGKFLVMTFVPGRHRLAFEQGTEYLDVSGVIPLTLSLRKHCLPDGRTVDMFDVRLHQAHVDPESRIVSYGGSGIEGGKPYSRCTLARYFNFTPFEGADRRILDSRNTAVYDAALACYEALEETIVGGIAAQPVPEFPKIYLGFTGDPDWDFERTAALEELAYRRIDRALRRGETESYPFLDKLKMVRGWKEVEARLTEEEVNFLLLSVWVGEERVLPDGLKIHPLDLFSVYSGQQPVRKALRVLAEFPDYFKGRKVMLPDGTIAIDHCLARCQVIRLPHPSALVGSVDGVEYDFSSVPLGQEAFFASASEL